MLLQMLGVHFRVLSQVDWIILKGCSSSGLSCGNISGCCLQGPASLPQAALLRWTEPKPCSCRADLSLCVSFCIKLHHILTHADFTLLRCSFTTRTRASASLPLHVLAVRARHAPTWTPAASAASLSPAAAAPVPLASSPASGCIRGPPGNKGLDVNL